MFPAAHLQPRPSRPSAAPPALGRTSAPSPLCGKAAGSSGRLKKKNKRRNFEILDIHPMLLFCLLPEEISSVTKPRVPQHKTQQCSVGVVHYVSLTLCDQVYFYFYCFFLFFFHLTSVHNVSGASFLGT